MSVHVTASHVMMMYLNIAGDGEAAEATPEVPSNETPDKKMGGKKRNAPEAEEALAPVRRSKRSRK